MAQQTAPPAPAGGASLVSSMRIGEPVAALNASGPYPFATIDLTDDGATYVSVRTPAEARALAVAFEHAALLLEHAARSGPEVTP